MVLYGLLNLLFAYLHIDLLDLFQQSINKVFTKVYFLTQDNFFILLL